MGVIKYNYKDLIGNRFGRLIALKLSYKKGSFIYLKCKCDCGNEKDVQIYNLLNKHINSCGCLRKELVKKGLRLRHGMTRTRFYRIWRSMNQRCFDKNSFCYSRWGGRGITVCKRWLKFENFRDDMYKSYLNHVEEFGEKNTSIDRVNNNENYCLKNTRWATSKQQGNNARTNHFLIFNNKKMTIAQWAERNNINYHTLCNRIHTYKWSIERALTEPVRKY